MVKHTYPGYMLHYNAKGSILLNLIPYILILASPFIASVIIYLSNGTSLFGYDAFNTALSNDELGYYHNVQMIRTWWSPQGYTGYNEVLAPKHGYGPYNFFTYIPYVGISFLTGIDSHNYMMYCNVIIFLLSLLIFVRFSGINIQQSIVVTIFLSTFLIGICYVFSGMTEAAHIAFMIIVFGMMINFYKSNEDYNTKKKRAIIWFVTILTIFYGIIRPYELVFLLLPIVYVSMKNKKTRHTYIFVTLALSFFTVILYYYLTNNYGSPYFEQYDGPGYYLEYIRNGQIFNLFTVIIQKNIAPITILEQLQNGSQVALVILLFLILMALTLALIIIKIWRKNQHITYLFDLVLLLISIAIYESVILFYTPTNLKRILLGLIVLLGLSLCIQLRGYHRFISVAPTICVMLVMIFVFGGNTFMLPQEHDYYLEKDAVLENTFESLMPYSDNHWDHTIAFEPQDTGLHLMYLFPSYMGMQCCHQSYLIENINNETLNSKYLWVRNGGLIDEACQKTGLVELWTDNEWSIYVTR